MYFSSKYSDHNDSLERFIKKFNSKTEYNLEMYANKNENFRDDGKIICLLSKKNIIFDWEKRFHYYGRYSKFKFYKLGQFERKIQKKEIKISIQCSLDETGILVAWHKDFLNEKKQYIQSKTQFSYERNAKRFTSKFKEFSTERLLEFKKEIRNSIDLHMKMKVKS